MRKYVATTDNSIGGMLIEGNKVVTATIVEGRKVVEILEATEDQLKNILPLASNIYNLLKDFFQSIFNPLPCVIKLDGEDYVRTEQFAPFSAIARIFYMSNIDANVRIFEFEGKTMGKAKRQLRQALKEQGYIK